MSAIEQNDSDEAFVRGPDAGLMRARLPAMFLQLDEGPKTGSARRTRAVGAMQIHRPFGSTWQHTRSFSAPQKTKDRRAPAKPGPATL